MGASARSTTAKNMVKVGAKIERHFEQSIKKLGIRFDKPPKVPISQAPTAKMDIDFNFPDEKVFVETTSCMKDGKFAKILVQSQNIKRYFPDYKLVVFVAQQTDNAMSYIKHLEACPFVDKVICFKKDSWKTLSEFREMVTERFKPLFKKTLKDRLFDDSLLIRKSLKEGLKPHDDGFYIPILDKRMEKHLRDNNVDIDKFIITGNLKKERVLV
tara:strand:+ start:682 stop:1323 length:642 start_codon:yes stop_codon:yes gene_type:complete